ncbi:MAG: hypothetical protein ACKO7P_13690, partial [Bacteroidota bacterium]
IAYNAYGQNECNLEQLPGEWKYTNLIHWGICTNIDSLKTISLSYKSNENSVIEFLNDSTYIISHKKTIKTSMGYYSLNKKKCELIILRKKKDLKNIKYRELHNWKIIYIDNEILIYTEDNNPKSIATHVLMKL